MINTVAGWLQKPMFHLDAVGVVTNQSVSCPFKNNIFTFYGLGPPFAKPSRDEVVKLVSRCTFCGQFQPAEFPISGPVTRRYSTMKCADTPNPPIFWRFKSRLLCLCLIGKRTLDGVCGSCTENKNHAVTAFCQTWFPRLRQTIQRSLSFGLDHVWPSFKFKSICEIPQVGNGKCPPKSPCLHPVGPKSPLAQPRYQPQWAQIWPFQTLP